MLEFSAHQHFGCGRRLMEEPLLRDLVDWIPLPSRVHGPFVRPLSPHGAPPRPSAPLPAPPAVSGTATTCPGRGRDGRVPYLRATARGGLDPWRATASAGLGQAVVAGGVGEERLQDRPVDRRAGAADQARFDRDRPGE